MPRYRFGDVSVDTDAIEISGPQGQVDVEPQVFAVLQYLIEQPGRLITKEELLDNVWGDRFVSESALTTRIKQVRRALGDDGRTQWAVKTVHGRGYRFVAERGTPGVNETVGSPPAPADPAPLPSELQADARQLFVGRGSELDQAWQVVNRSPADESYGWVWLIGEPGIGKTRLAAEIARHAQQDGHRVLFGRNDEDLVVPFQPFIEVMRSVIDDIEPDHRTPYLDTIAAELSPLLPEGLMSEEADVRLADNPTDNDTQRFQLFEAIAGWLGDHARVAPLTLIIDDVHWAADSTLQLLSYLQRRTEGAAVTFVITSRDTAPDINSLVANLLAAGQGNRDSTLLRLEGLSGGDALRLVGADVDLDSVMRQTAWNPLLLQAVNQADGSVDIESAVRHRLASLDDSVQETLRVASILGLEFDLRVAAAATGRTELDVLDDLEYAIAARLLDDVGLDRFRFTHALIRSSLRARLSSARQARMHATIAEAINQVFSDERRHLPALAYHTAAAAEVDPGLRPLAVDRLEMAATESTLQLSFDEAARSLERAVALADPADTSLRARLTLEQGIAETRAGASTTAARTFQRAVPLVRLSGDPTMLIETALRYEDANWRPGRSGAQALDYLAEAADVLEAAAADQAVEDIAELRARMAIARLRALAMSGQIDEAERAFAPTLELARGVGSSNLEAAAVNVYLSQVRFFRGLDGTDLLVSRLAELQPTIDDGDVALHTVHVRTLHATLQGEFGRVRELADLMTHLQEQSHSTFWRFIRLNQEALESFHLGDLAGAEALAEACLEAANELPDEDGSGTYGLRMFMIRREQDRLASIAPLVRHVLSSNDVEGIWTPGLALLLVETGSEDQAIDAVRAIKANNFDLPLDAMWSTVMVFLIETMVNLGDLESCVTLRSLFEPLAGTNVTTGSGLLSFGRADRYLGMLSLVLGELDVAEEYLGVALEADAESGSALWANESRLWLSRVRRAQGHDAEADAMVDVVAKEARASGLHRLERLASMDMN